DCSHGNSAKDHKRQPAVARAVAAQVAEGTQDVFGVMLESHLIEGNQKQQASSELIYGQSITDACIGWEDTVEVLEELAAAVRTQRQK
ncbi:MAG: 3-deoxy-7-phosphoheptulonate synthase, partial [Gemmatimonadetes bacterium]|nr:3-deoxy-7-phosphoheptulonate synthase [Gemmatimonadota bacterium]